MVGFVVDDQDVLFGAKLLQYPAAKGSVALHAALHYALRAAVVFGLEEMPVGLLIIIFLGIWCLSTSLRF